MKLQHSQARNGGRAALLAKTAGASIEPLAVSVREAARLSGLCEATIWNRITDKTLDTTKAGRRRLVNFASLKRLVLGDQAAA